MYLPKHQPQLNRGTRVPGATQGSRDCGPRTVQMGVDFLTKGELVPSIETIRRRMGKRGPKTTNVYDAERAIDGWRAVRGRQPLRYFIKTFIADVKAAVKGGKYVQCCIDYGTFNRLAGRTGDPNFTGGHSVGVLGQRQRQGSVEWLCRLYDPLDDGRRAGIPEGPRWVKRDVIIKSMEAFARGRGRCYAGVFGGGQQK